ncbi:Hypothetical protein HVR_LOCUS1346, partial [uncultured virus]
VKAILICGYRRTGKDTLNTKLQMYDSSRDLRSQALLFKWRIYKHPDRPNIKFPHQYRSDYEMDLLIDEDKRSSHPPLSGIINDLTTGVSSTPKKNSNIKYLQTAFAKPLKEESAQKYGIPMIVSDADKDNKQFIHYQTGQLVSARDIYIEWGASRRSQNPDYWCEATFISMLEMTTDLIMKSGSAQLEADSSNSQVDDVWCVVTDWRYRNESRYLINKLSNYEIPAEQRSNILTVRLYRSEVPEPDANIDSEHDLDSVCTDFLLLRDDVEGELEKAIEKFPQYSEFVPYDTI